jgi:hypothetical protein
MTNIANFSVPKDAESLHEVAIAGSGVEIESITVAADATITLKEGFCLGVSDTIFLVGVNACPGESGEYTVATVSGNDITVGLDTSDFVNSPYGVLLRDPYLGGVATLDIYGPASGSSYEGVAAGDGLNRTSSWSATIPFSTDCDCDKTLLNKALAATHLSVGGVYHPLEAISAGEDLLYLQFSNTVSIALTHWALVKQTATSSNTLLSSTGISRVDDWRYDLILPAVPEGETRDYQVKFKPTPLGPSEVILQGTIIPF